MASKADRNAAATRAGTTETGASAAAGGTHSTALVAGQPSVLLVQVEALADDDAIRNELKRHGFRIKHQALVHLAKEDARHFVLEVCDPSSALHADRGAAPASSRGPVLMLAVEKPNAVADLLELVGPANPELWNSSAPDCLRARFGKSSTALGVRCSLQESTVALEIEFLLACSGPSREGRLSLHGAGGIHSASSSSKAVKSGRSAEVDLEQLLDFLFPRHLQHPNSAGRLFVFGLYGPLDAKARLRSGEKGLHVVTDLELTTMSKRMEREDILSVYKMCSLSQEEEEAVLMQVDQLMKSFPQYTPRDIRALFQSLLSRADAELDADNVGHHGTRVLSFHEMQAAIMKERCRRVLCMKEKLHPALAPPIQNKYRATLKRLAKSADEVAPASFFLKDAGFTGAENATLVARLLSNHSFAICHLDDGNSPSLTQNVRLLRDEIRPPGEARAPWNPNCQHQRLQYRK
ncbi:hypothetical protein PybrP1_006273 [[Pythium] brassicae (nom. inval.)]|nr:hypothetical protein PybrP1_006273 [[Pythium] brassicae (nom. inval.)]